MRKVACAFLGRILLAIAVGVIAAPAYAANFVVNGGFEVPIVEGNFDTYTTLTTPPEFGWIVDASIDHIHDLWISAEGDQSVDLVGFTGAGGVSQLLDLALGTYELTFARSGNPFGGGTRELQAILAGGAIALETYSFDTTGRSFTDMGWIYETILFEVTLPVPTLLTFSSALNFDANGSPVCCQGAALDDVSITQVPEPSMLLLLSGTALAVAARRRIRAN